MSAFMSTAQQKWWKNGTAYQIWPASYKDSNGDGIGDIPGIISTLDYIRDLGVDYIWLSPMYDSPQNDMGYDISNYEDVYHKYGTLQDMENLIRETHARGMRLILDLVVNHTSSHHRWFQESMKSKTNLYSDWYVWRDPKYVNGVRQPPNNWSAQFGSSAWKYVRDRDQYYLHLFHSTMPDLNWHNPTTRQGIYKSAIEFWLKKGIDGFRVDVVNFYCKDLDLPETEIIDPDLTYQKPDRKYYLNGPKMHEWLKEQRLLAMDKYSTDLVLVGELHGTDTREVLSYISAKERELDMVFDFAVINLSADIPNSDTATNGKRQRHAQKQPHHFLEPFKFTDVKHAIMKTQSFLSPSCAVSDAWPTVFLENHDTPRSVSRFGSPNPIYHNSSAKLLALMLTTLSGSLFLYQGQEIGMTNIPQTWTKKDLRDVAYLNYLEKIEATYPGDKAWKKKAMDATFKMGRDNTRTPVQWTGEGKWAGFMDENEDDDKNKLNEKSTTKAEPWIRVNENFKSGINVQDQSLDPHSVLNFWKQALTFRKKWKDLLIYGLTEMVDLDDEHTMTYTKKSTSVASGGGNGDGDSDDSDHTTTSTTSNHTGNTNGSDTHSKKTKTKTMLITLNFSDQQKDVFIPDDLKPYSDAMELVMSTIPSSNTGNRDEITSPLQPWEGRVYLFE